MFKDKDNYFFSKSVYDINENEEEFLKNDTVIDRNKKYKIFNKYYLILILKIKLKIKYNKKIKIF